MPQPDVEDATATCVYCGFPAAEPEQDGEFGYFSCPDCGGDFGYRKLAPDGPLCAAGLPIQVSAAQPAGVLAIKSGEERASVFLGPTIRRRQE